ncbi:MAG: exodeoxyribonuclease VII large subunit [Candidatus Omnitrophica bacterium]|nr:exodeoxyribonuclease VII large subunit [Candidatus Omnitrophota bacterium]
MQAITTDQKVYTISELTREIRRTIENNFSGIWIEGEVSNFLRHTSGHMYLSLKDSGSQIQAVIFRNVNQSLRFEMKDGLHILAYGKVTVYDKRGQYQIVIERVEPKGVGALELALRQLTEKLRAEGLFLPAHKKPLPFLPNRIGVITSPTGAVIRDILHVSKRRFPSIPVLLYPVKVQGDGAAGEIAKAIEDMNRLHLCDVLIVGRGGGSLEDLWAFNEEIVARAIYNSGIPIISAVGHEIDVTISDLVSDRRAATPSQAAELAVPSAEELSARARQTRGRMTLAVKNLIAGYKEQTLHLKESYALTQPGRIVEQARQRLDDALKQIAALPGRMLVQAKNDFENLARQMTNYFKHLVEARKSDFAQRAAQLEALSPLAVLTRGYSITSNEKGKLIRSANEVRVGEEIITKVAKGEIRSKVTKIT